MKKTLVNGKAAIVIVCILTIAIAGACLATPTENNAGDPTSFPPGSATPEPTPVILNLGIAVLAAVVSILLT